MSSTVLKVPSRFEPISWPLRIFSVLRSIFVLLVSENIFLWRFMQGRRNDQAEVEGPYYIVGAPNRQLEEGKAVLASFEDLETFGPYLITITIKSPKGEPVPYARFDWWQADGAGSYSMTTYRLRGKFTADANGKVEIISVAPGKYGPEGYKRAGHFHLIISDTRGQQWEPLTTQFYVVKGNDAKELGTDFLNFVRPARPANVLQSWSIPVPGERFMDLPPLAADDKQTNDSVQWWNAKFAEWGQELKVAAGAQAEIKMNAPPRWLFF